MTYRRRHRWLRRLALGLAFATFAAPAAAKPDEGGDGVRYVTAGGWSGYVDSETGIPVSAGIPNGNEPFVGDEPTQVIPYLSQGIGTEADQAAAAAEAIHDPYLTDVFVRPGESLGGPDGDAVAFKNALETQAAAQAEAIHDPYLTDVFVRPGESLGGPDGTALQSQSVLGEAVKTQQAAEPQLLSHRQMETLATENGVSTAVRPDDRADRFTGIEQPQVISYLSHGMAADGEVGARPDNKADRFAHSDVASRTELASSGSSVSWDAVITLGIGSVVLALALGLGLGFIKRPKLAGL